MDNILEPNENFDFSLLGLGQPNSIQGGAYFTKLQHKEKPLYIETPKSLTRQGFVKNGKKMVVDLMFDNTNEEFIHWLENLETKCQELIYEKGESWFQNKLEMNDIETAFNSPLKVYKSGKFYLVRVNVKMNYSTNNPYVKIFNENEIPLTIDDVNSETNVISVLEIQGIKFTTRSFQIEMEVKQMMILNTYEIFENCVIKHKSKTVDTEKNKDVEDTQKTILSSNEIEVGTKEEPLVSNPDEPSQNLIVEDDLKNKDEVVNEIVNEIVNENIVDNLINLNPLDENDLTEVNIDNIENLETIQLKKPNQVYYEIYKEARKKAKEAKKSAIVAFLEAKNIKKTYMLEDLDDSDESSMENFSDEDYHEDEDEDEELLE